MIGVAAVLLGPRLRPSVYVAAAACHGGGGDIDGGGLLPVRIPMFWYEVVCVISVLCCCWFGDGDVGAVDIFAAFSCAPLRITPPPRCGC